MDKKNIFIIIFVILLIAIFGFMCYLLYSAYKSTPNKTYHSKFFGGISLEEVRRNIKEQYINFINVYSKVNPIGIFELSYSINALDFLDGPNLENINDFKIYFTHEPLRDEIIENQFEIVDALERYIKEHYIDLFININDENFEKLANNIINNHKGKVWETWLNKLIADKIEYKNDIINHLKELHDIIFNTRVNNFFKFQFQLGNIYDTSVIKKTIFNYRRDVIENANLINNNDIKKKYYQKLGNNNQLGVIQSFIGFKMNEEIFLAWNKSNIENNSVCIMQTNNVNKLQTLNIKKIERNKISLNLPLRRPIYQNNVRNNHSITASFWINDRFVVLKPINIYQYRYEHGWNERLNYVRNVVEVLKLLTISIEDDGLYLLRPQYVFRDNYAKIHELYVKICKATISERAPMKLRVNIKKIYNNKIDNRTLLENSQFFIIGSETTYYMIVICNYKRFIIKFKQIRNFEIQFSDLKFDDFEITIIENINDIIVDIRTNLELIINYNEEYSKRDILMPVIDEIIADPNNYENNYLFKYALDLNDATDEFKMQFIKTEYRIEQYGLQSFYIDHDFNLYLRAHDTTSQIIIPYIYNEDQKKYVLNLDNIVDNRRDNFWGEKINGNHISFGGHYSNVIYETNHIIVENMDDDYNKIPPYMLL